MPLQVDISSSRRTMCHANEKACTHMMTLEFMSLVLWNLIWPEDVIAPIPRHRKPNKPLYIIWLMKKSIDNILGSKATLVASVAAPARVSTSICLSRLKQLGARLVEVEDIVMPALTTKATRLKEGERITPCFQTQNASLSIHTLCLGSP